MTEDGLGAGLSRGPVLASDHRAGAVPSGSSGAFSHGQRNPFIHAGLARLCTPGSPVRSGTLHERRTTVEELLAVARLG